MAGGKYHRPYLVTAACFALVGTPLGAAMLCALCGWLPSRSWPAQLEAHAQMQAYGFVVLFTMGIAHQMLHQVYGQARGRGWMTFSLVTMALGTFIASLRPVLNLPIWVGPLLQFIATTAFLKVTLGNGLRKVATPVHAYFLRLGTLWLMAALALRGAGFSPIKTLDLTLWGFVSLYILGVGLRMHPQLLNRVLKGSKIAPPGALPQWVLLGLWHIGLMGILNPSWRPATDLGWLTAASLIVWRLRVIFPPKSWFSLYLGTSYLWLVVATLGRVAQSWGWSGMGVEGAVRHSLATGFILTMMMGMAYRLVPAFESKELRWPLARLICYIVLTSGTLLRVTGEASLGKFAWAATLTPWAGFCQAAAVLLFVAALVSLT